MKIEKVAVIGAGFMGSGIAAHVANAGLPVTLLDIVPKGTDNRNVIAETAVQKMLKPVKMGSPTPLMHHKNAKRISTGNIEDHLDKIEHADLIIEVVLEKLNIRVKEIEEKYTEPVNRPRPENKPKFQRNFDRNDRSSQKKKSSRFKNRKRKQFGRR